jgi:uncharacterized protein
LGWGKWFSHSRETCISDAGDVASTPPRASRHVPACANLPRQLAYVRSDGEIGHDAPVIWMIAVMLVVVGLIGVVVPVIPGAVLIFSGLLVAAWADGFARVGVGTIIVLGILTAATYVVDVATMALGMKRLGTTKRAMAGGAAGTIAGVFFGLPGLLVGPFIGAALGELTAHRDVRRAGRAGFAAWAGFLVGTIVKVALAFAMVAIFLMAWGLTYNIAPNAH